MQSWGLTDPRLQAELAGRRLGEELELPFKSACPLPAEFLHAPGGRSFALHGPSAD